MRITSCTGGILPGLASSKVGHSSSKHWAHLLAQEGDSPPGLTNTSGEVYHQGASGPREGLSTPGDI